MASSCMPTVMVTFLLTCMCTCISSSLHTNGRRLTLASHSHAQHLMPPQLKLSLAAHAHAHPEYVLRPATYGADPSGQTDSSAAFAALIQAAWKLGGGRSNGTTAPDLGGIEIDLVGGSYLLDAPIVFPPGGGSNWKLRDGTLQASASFPPNRFVVELNATNWPTTTFEGVVVSGVVFDGNHRASGMACMYCNHITIDSCWFYRFALHGYFAYDGHENYVSNCWFSQCEFNNVGGHGGAANATGTGVNLQSSDSSIVDSVIYCTRLGFFINAGNGVVMNVHVYNTGHEIYNSSTTSPSAWMDAPFGGGYVSADGVRLIGLDFDDCILVVDNAQNVQVTNSLFLLGAWTYTGGVILRAKPKPHTTGIEMQGFNFQGNQIRHAPSFDRNSQLYLHQRFFQLDDSLERFNVDGMQNILIEHATSSDVASPLNYSVQTTVARASVTLADQAVATIDFASQLLFKRIEYAQVTVTHVNQAAATHTSATEQYTTSIVNATTVVVTMSGPVSAIVSVEVRQCNF